MFLIFSTISVILCEKLIFINGAGDFVNQLNCTPYLDDLKFTPHWFELSEPEVNITWNSNPTKECNFQYRVSMEIYSNSVKISNYTEENYYVQQIKPCTAYNFTVEISQKGNETILNALSQTWSVDIPKEEKVRDVRYSSSIDSIKISWTPSKFASVCNISYAISSNKNDNYYYRFGESTSHLLKNLVSCTKYEVSITPSDVLTTIEDPSQFIYAVSTLPEKVKNLNLKVIFNMSVVSWTPPGNHKCIIGYNISSSPILLEQFTADTTLSTKDSLYCRLIVVQPISKDGHPGEKVALLKPDRVSGLKITPTNSSLHISWTPPLDNCTYKYLVEVDNRREFATIPEFAIYGLNSCQNYAIRVTSISTNGDYGEGVVAYSRTKPPIELSTVDNLHFQLLEYGKKLLNLTWTPPRNAKACGLSYSIRINDDEDNCIYHIPDTTNTTLSINLSSAITCIRYRIIVVATYLGLVRSNSTSIPIKFNETPGRVKQLKLSRNDTSLISWKAPENSQCIVGYNISSSLFVELTNRTHFKANRSLYCVPIDVLPIGDENRFGKAVRIINPGSVRELNVFPSDTSISISWSPPLNDSCTNGYLVQVIDNGFEKVTNNTQLVVANLSSCKFYTIAVRAKAERNYYGNPEIISGRTALPKELEQVQNLKIVIYNRTMLNVTWEPLKDAKTCNINYLVQIRDEKNTSIYNKTTPGNYLNVDFNEAIFCAKYSLSVVAFVGPLKSEVRYENLVISEVKTAPECTAQQIKSAEVVLQCNFEDHQLNRCPTGELIVTCVNKNLISNNSVVVKKKVASLDSNVTVVVADLQKLSPYECSAVVNGSFGTSSKSNFVKFTTAEGVPDAPELQKITSYTNISFDVSWTYGPTMSRTLTQYYVTVECLGPTYFIPNDCLQKDRLNHTYTTNTTTFFFSQALPSTTYKISVQPSNRVGFGPISNIQLITTKGGIPEEPRQTNFSLTKSSLEPYNVSLPITWSYPCYTNGLISDFRVELNGESYVGDNVTRHELVELIRADETTPKLNYEFTINSLRPAFNYTLSITVVNKDNSQSRTENMTFRSYESYPEPPVGLEAFQLNSTEVTLKWNESLVKNGIIKNYMVRLENEGPQYWTPQNCTKELTASVFNVAPTETTFTYKYGLPDHKYNFQISSSTGVGSSNLTEKMSVLTSTGVPEQVRDLKYNFTQVRSEDYNASTEVTFKYPCNTFGAFKKFSIALMEVANVSEEYTFTEATDDYSHTFANLLPGRIYTIVVQVVTENYTSSESKLTFRSTDGVPPKIGAIQPPISHNSTTANFVLQKNLFADTNGLILYYALILSELNYEEKSKFGFWNGNYKTWPFVEKNYSNGIGAYQATPEFWNPFTDNDLANITFMLGEHGDEFNKPLLPEITYTLKVRGLTNNGYRDSPIVTFRVASAETKLSLILGLTFGIFGTVAIIILIFIILRKRQNWNQTKNCAKSIQLTPIPISISKFMKIYHKLNQDEAKLKEEFKLLNEKSNESLLPTYDALSAENKKRNRYTNVLPYDETRVKLLDKNENDSNDYINASYIRGYSGNVEYIATQGPLEGTVGDFWKMVIQENSSLIVMVAQFVEQNKDKCYKYFPDNHENLELENGIAVRCCTELDFKTHVIRTFMVQKELQQWTVTHLQFTNWPDFGCPEGTEVILEFCHLMREHAERNSDPIIAHCSAGVGRTGTLIALDVLLQAINSNRDIDIFGTVLNLRKDRKNMVQTDKQYLFIYTCIENALRNPEPIRYAMMSSSDPIYENLDELKKENKEYIEESKF